MAFGSLLDEVLEAWSYTRRSVIDEIRNMSESELRARPHPESRSPAEIAHHIVESGLMMSGELSRPDGDFLRKPHPDLVREHWRAFWRQHAGEYASDPRRAKKSEIVGMLRRSQAEGSGKIRKAGELHMLQAIHRFDGERGSRLAWMNHGIAHEEYHRGQLALLARLAGRVPALTKRIHGTG